MEHQLRKDRDRIHKNGEMDRRGLCIIPSSHFGPLNWFIRSASLLRRKFKKIRQGFPKRSLLMEKVPHYASCCALHEFTRIVPWRPTWWYISIPYAFVVGAIAWWKIPLIRDITSSWFPPSFGVYQLWLFDLPVPPLGGRRRRWRKRHVPMRSTTKTANLKQHLISPQSSLFIT